MRQFRRIIYPKNASSGMPLICPPSAERAVSNGGQVSAAGRMCSRLGKLRRQIAPPAVDCRHHWPTAGIRGFLCVSDFLPATTLVPTGKIDSRCKEGHRRHIRVYGDAHLRFFARYRSQGQCIMKKRPASEGRSCDGRSNCNGESGAKEPQKNIGKSAREWHFDLEGKDNR
jgi:hypothetical protein